MTGNFYDQSEFALRLGWGEHGVTALGPGSDVVIIVDILSFSTAVDVAVSRGSVVFPFGQRGASAVAFAQQQQAELADMGQRYSLAPASMQTLPSGTRLILPSPNGSTLTTLAGANIVVTGCLRNYRAVAHFAQALGQSIAVIAAGERWPDRSLRPALEDLIGAGAILSELHGTLSPEAQAATAVFHQAQPDLLATLLACSSGKELVQKGLIESVKLAAELGSSTAVPYLQDGAYVNRSQSG